jgi:hypothetical protein
MPEAMFIRNGWYTGEEDPQDHDNPWYINVFFQDRDKRKSDIAIMHKLVNKLWMGHVTITRDCMHHTRSHCISLLVDHEGSDLEKTELAYRLAQTIRETVYSRETTINRNKLFRGEGLGIMGLMWEMSQLDHR